MGQRIRGTTARDVDAIELLSSTVESGEPPMDLEDEERHHQEEVFA